MHFLQQKRIRYGIAVFAILFLAVPLYAQAACGFHNVSGYVWSRNSGWISLNCNAGGSIDYGLDIDFESGSQTEPVTGYAWSQNYGWLNMQPAGPYPAAPNTAALFTRNEGELATSTAGTITGWAQWSALGANGWMLLGPLTISSTEYGIGIGADRLFTGWSWNGGDNLDADPEPERGDGWVLWDSVESGGGASVLAYWFESLYGDIYSGSSVSAPFAPPLNRYNATYLIQANGTVQPVAIQSQAGNSVPAVSDSFDSLSIPDTANNYKGALGWLDKAGMLAGRYGTLETALPAGSSILLNGNVYYYSGDLTLNSALALTKGTADQKGSGTIIVEGNLNINADIAYQSGAVGTSVANLPSVAWIVKGNIVIDDDVQNLAGVFFSEGAISTGTKGTSLAQFELPLAIHGMLIAKTINLQRLFADQTQEPAEQIIFDGRAIINPPPGLADIGKGLPILRETRP
jgi:hypothetical protein